MIDTAEVYRGKDQADGQWKSNESVVGKAIKDIGRDNIVVCTKHFPGGWESIWEGKAVEIKTKEDVKRVVKAACENSLKELDIECIDLYYLHRMYPAPIEIEDVMEVYKGINQYKYSVLPIMLVNKKSILSTYMYTLMNF